MTILISKVNQLGDNVVFLPVVQALRAMIPSARLVIVTSPVAQDLYTRCVPGAEVVTSPTAAFNGAWKKPWHLAKLAATWRSFKPAMIKGTSPMPSLGLRGPSCEWGRKSGPFEPTGFSPIAFHLCSLSMWPCRIGVSPSNSRS